jgi:predicted amidohydrolase
MADLQVAWIQTHLHWENPEANRAHFEELIWQLPHNQDLIILPEMFTTGFAVQAKHLAEPMNLHTHKWMKQMAAQTGAVLAGSVMVSDQNQIFNRLIWQTPDGFTGWYDKRHLFSFAGENLHISAGKQLPVFQLKGWNICPQICYDLRFPVFVRNVELKYDFLFYVANWPEPRIQAWDTLLPARAIENSSYVLGVNRTGTDGNGLNYCGHSALYDFKGYKLLGSTDSIKLYHTSLSKDALLEYRAKFPVHNDADAFSLLY